MQNLGNNRWRVDEIPEEGMTLLDLIRRENIAFQAPCNGKGVCGKCGVYIDGEFTLSCGVLATEGMEFAIPDESKINENSIQTDSLFKTDVIPDGKEGELGVAVDIGTTTIVAYLYDLHTGEQLAVTSDMNPQKSYGADVISRIDYANSGDEARNVLRMRIVEQINNMVDVLLKKADELPLRANKDVFASKPLARLVVTGNTTMLHFFAGWDASGIAVAPFKAFTYDAWVLSGEEALLPKADKVIIMPSVSAYVGGDIVAGITSCRMDREVNSDKTVMLIDIGTNGEMAISHNGKLFACSTAAGPAFEGANIYKGMPGLDGAICKVVLENGFKIETVGNSTPKGICGSGLLDLMACALDSGLVDETGRIVDDDEVPDEFSEMAALIKEGENGNYIEIRENTISGVEANNDMILIQKDVREIQNAKAAIYAGITVLCQRAGTSPADVDTIYLAGGFGTHLSPESAIRIGLLPEAFAGKIIGAGNSAGSGAIELLLSEKELEHTKNTAQSVEYIELSTDPLFVNEYVNAMIFE